MAWLFTALLVVSCESAPEPEEYVIAVGGGPDLQPVAEVAQARVEEILGNDPPVRVVWAEVEGGDPADRAVQVAVEYAANPAVVAVVGHSGSRTSLAAAPVYSEAGIPMVIPNATSDQLDDAGPWAFRLVPGNRAQGQFMADFASHRLGASRAITFYEPDDYGIGLRDGFREAFRALGGQVLDEVQVDDIAAYDLLVDQALLNGEPDVLILAARAPAAAGILARTAERGVSARVIAGDGVVDMDSVRAMAPAAVEDLFSVGFWHPSSPNPMSEEFLSSFLERYGEPPTYNDAMFYEGIVLLALAIQQVGPDRRAIREYLSSVGTPARPVSGLSGALSFVHGPSGNLIMVRVASDSIVERMSR